MQLKAFIELLRCPVCHMRMRIESREQTAGLEDIIRGSVACDMGHQWAVEEGILVFTREDAPSDAWTRSQKDYAAYAASTPVWVEYSASQVAPILEPIARHGSNLHLDICTGQGGLLYNLLKCMEPTEGTLSVEMSLHVHRFNSRYLREKYPCKRVGLIAGDASQLPLADSSIDTVSSYGMGNMLEKMRAGMKEVARVLRPGGLFAFNHIAVPEGSRGWQAFEQGMRQMGATDYRFAALRNDFEEMMKASGFCGYEIKTISETVGEANRDWEAGPTFPFPNEPMVEMLITAWK